MSPKRKTEDEKVVSLHVKLKKNQRSWVQEQAIAYDMTESEFERRLHQQAMRTADPLGNEYQKAQAQP